MKKKFKLNADLLGKKAGDVLELECDTDGTPLDRFWRLRLKDSEKDNCIELVESKKPKKEPKTTKKEESKAEEKEEMPKGEGDK